MGQAAGQKGREANMETVGVIGLGVMGAPMAANLVKAGYDVIGYCRSPGPVERLAAAGGRAATSVADVTARADAVLTVLPDSPDVEEVVLGADGVLRHARDGLLLIDFSTVRPETSAAVAEAARKAGVRPLDAPVSGGERGAIDGTLSIMAGGREEDFAAARPLFEAVGRTVVHVGGDGAGQTVKAANQMIVGGVIALVSEALVLLEASGVPADSALTVLKGGLAGNQVMNVKGESMLARSFEPGFRIDLHHKDLGIALSVARSKGVATPLTGVVAQLLTAARARGLGSLDHSALLLLVEELAGRAPVREGHA
ncbi:2-hydroxy-3-oxopropionate reductase [Streptomyces sp. NPDC050546]|uniref:2-hydroxy-3-oxopropionate reductase n=1 Tax=Streptomyces sp. NPDC050546 TaxID=3365628 RepID=UPI0037B53F20